MKKLFIILILPFIIQIQASFAQSRFSFKVGAGGTLTFVPDFQNRLLVADGMAVPYYIYPTNAMRLNVATARSTSKAQVGWYGEAEASYSLPRNFALTFAVGVKTLHYDYRSEYDTPSMETESPDDYSDDFGNTTLTYLSIAPFNISKACLQNRLVVQAGPVLNILLQDKTNNVVAVYYSQRSVDNGLPDVVFFDTLGEFRKMIAGLNVGVSYKIAGPVQFKLSGQYYFSSMYDDDDVYGLDDLQATDDKINPFVLQVGLVFAF